MEKKEALLRVALAAYDLAEDAELVDDQYYAYLVAPSAMQELKEALAELDKTR